MIRIIFLCVVILLCPVFLWAGPIYGIVLFKGSAFRGAAVNVNCAGVPAPAVTTRDDGSYRIVVPREGRCTFTLSSGNVAASTDVVSTPNAAEYNFEVVQRGDGGYELRRR